MKKLKPYLKLFLDKKSRFVKKSDFKYQNFKKILLALGVSNSKANLEVDFRKRRLEVQAPEILNLSENYEEVVDFFNLIRNTARLKFRRLRVNFATIKKLSPLCALMLVSEVDLWQTQKGRLRCYDTDNWDPNIKRLLDQMGFLKLINPINPYVIEAGPTNHGFIEFKTGTQNFGQLADELSSSLTMIAGSIGFEHLLYSGLTEAMQNTIDWAYPESMNISANLRKWWMTAYYNSSERSATVMVYDHGVGIPKTLPKSGIWDNCRAFIEKLEFPVQNDATLIKAAMSVGRSASRKNYRGKGLKNVQSFIRANKTGELRVISGKGEYKMSHDGNEKIILHDNPIRGTLIAWQVGLK